ncbi:hypothetical protein [Nocardia rhizosphaerae]|uniref:Uncharacterized protein n=1 Tax=Nocardia rhizosphaerae TaxID=1691571 RepID=A0ABV8L5G1_9NOCA
MTYIRNAGSHWSGDAYLAAYDRVAGDRAAATRAATLVNELGQQLIDGGNTMTSHRTTVLSKVDDALSAGADVSDDWAVTAATGSSISADDTAYHQSQVTSALSALLTAQTALDASARTTVAEVSTAASVLSPNEGTSTQQISALVGSPIAAANTGDESGATGNPATTTPAKTTPAQTIAAQTATTAQPGAAPQPSGTPISGDTTGGTTTPATTAPSTPSTPTGTGSDTNSAFDPDNWSPENVISLLDTISKFTGSLPDILDKLSTLASNTDEIITAIGTAGAAMIEASNSAQVTGTTAPDTSQSSAGNPSEATTAEKPTTPTDPGAGDTKGSNGSGNQAGTPTSPASEKAPSTTPTAAQAAAGPSQTTASSFVTLPSASRNANDHQHHKTVVAPTLGNQDGIAEDAPLLNI